MLQLLAWLCEEGADHAASANAATALEAMAQAPGLQGMLVACDWLGDILCHLARDVQAYHTLHAVRGQQSMRGSQQLRVVQSCLRSPDVMMSLGEGLCCLLCASWFKQYART